MDAVQLMAIGSGVMAAGAGVLAFARPRTNETEARLEVRFPAEVTEVQVKAILGGISGMRRESTIGVETIATVETIRYFVTLPEREVPMLRGQMRGAMPGVRLIDAEPLDRRLSEFVRVELDGPHPLLTTTGSNEAAASLLGVLSELISGEKVTLRWRLTPLAPPRLPKSDRKPGKETVARDQLKSLRAKYQGMVLGCRLEIEVQGRSRSGALDLAHRIVGMLRSRVIRGRFTLRTNGRIERLVVAVAHRGPAPLSPGELVGIIGWPVGSPSLPNLELGTAPQLAADSSIPYEGKGRRVGTSTWPGKEDRQLVQPPEGALSHALLVGPTGSGKSTLMVEMAADDLRDGRGLVLIDLKGDTAEDVLARVPEHRAGEVIVLDPAAGLAVPGLRVLGGTDPELAADQLLTTFKGIFTDSWGVRSDQYLRLGFVTLAHDPEATLADLGFLFSDASFRRRMTGNLEDPMLTAAWASYEAMKPAEQSQHLASPLRKVNEVIGRRVVRAVLAQTKPRFDMNQVLARGQVVVVSLSPGRIGGPAATLIGALVIYEIYKAVLARQAVPQTARKPFGLYIDEPKLLTQGTPLPLDSMFELFRGLGVGINLAAQSVGQLGRDLQKAAVSNSGTLVAFRQNRADADLLARELPGIDAESLLHLPRFEAVARLTVAHGQVARPATVKTPAPSSRLSDPAEIRRISAARFGVDPVEVDRMLRHRHGQETSTSEQTFGRRRRTS